MTTAPPRGAVILRRGLLWGLLVGALLSVGVAAAWSRWSLGHQPPPVLGAVPPFSLVNRDGRTVTAAELAGAPWIADFVFTRCAASCPLMSERMAALAKELDLAAPASPSAATRGPRLHFVSFSVDPDRDTPAALAAYAARYRAPPAWLFLTGSQADLHHLSRDGFKLAVEPAGGPGSSEQAEPILHSTRFVLVDSQGRIRGYYDGLDPESVRKLETDLKAIE